MPSLPRRVRLRRGEENRIIFRPELVSDRKIPLAEQGGLVFLKDYPRAASSLAVVSGEGGDAFAERWELYWNGVEPEELPSSKAPEKRYERLTTFI